MNIIFDLDGTLIDSSAGILRAVELAFNACKIDMKLPLTSDLVGPPLGRLLEMLSGTDDEQVINQLAEAFKQCYDTEGYKETTVFEGVHQLLKQLSQHGMKLFIATNKRMIPTQKILTFFNWSEYFEGVYALDVCEEANNKSELIAHVLSQNNLAVEESIYVGDTVPDRIASAANDLPFVMVAWGYEFVVSEGDSFVESTSELSQFLMQSMTQ